MNDYAGLSGTTPIASLPDSRLRVRRKGNTGDRQGRGRESYRKGRDEPRGETRERSAQEKEERPDYGSSKSGKKFGRKVDLVI